ncbi:MAG: succinate dehydrogenase, hydrophobic membrane anchor protein [Celeribacter sp.]|jgi:succinate dehydrogenase / fumarate reductase membrane anchor subunit
MSFLTDRKRAIGLGSAKSGTKHFWQMQMSSYALVVIVPLFVFTFGPLLGASYEDALARLSRPFPAVITGLMLVVGLHHFRSGCQVAIEDYVGGHARRISIIAMACFVYAVMATGLFALVKLAL